uniref:Putative reverse transcriptase domain-containing protein n=1 Tax=Tanacetum cinerariifolium TaxID=118510 RepID=A0A699H8G3_TANCI|nr:putative reverse transcriptase domain-containing protein [Tanacetum cinerariifolium]
MTPTAIEEMINRRVTEALETHEANRNIGLGNGNDEGGNENDNSNKNGGGNGNGNHNENDRDARPVVRECTYQDFMKCQPLNFKGTKGVVKLIRWFEKMEIVPYQQLSREIPSQIPRAYQLCTKMVLEEEDRVMKFIGGLLDNIQGNVIAAEPTRLQDAVCMANNLMDQTLKGYAMRNAENKRKFDNSQKDNSGTNFLKLKDQNHGNKTGNKSGVGEARGKAYVLGGGDANPDSNVIMGTFLLNNHYAFILFNSGADRSFVSTTFSTLLDKIPDTLDVSYGVELANGGVSKTNTILRGCTLGLLGHPFNIDLMPVELGSFDVIMGMAWLANHHAVIMCDEKIVQIPYGDEVLIVQGQVRKKETKDKSEEKRLEDAPTIRDFSEVFPEEILGLPPTQQVEFQIDLVPSVAPMA